MKSTYWSTEVTFFKKIWPTTNLNQESQSPSPFFTPGEPGVAAETTEHKPSVDSERERVESMGLELQTTIHDDGALL